MASRAGTPDMQRIVIADDSSTARLITRRCVEALGFQDAYFIEVENGAAALAAVRENDPDIVITDLVMPVMGGAELVRALAAEGGLQHLKVVIVSSAANPAVAHEFAPLGIAIVSKPVSPAKLGAVLAPAGQGGWG